EIRFQYGPNGKPALADLANFGPLYFNLAHTHAQGVVAISREAEIGVDVEAIRPIPNLSELASLIFSKEERAQWGELEPSRRLRFFFHCWTLKEAFLKALGMGLGGDLDDIAVQLGLAGEPPAIRVKSEPGRWSFESTELLECAMATAVRSPHAQVRLW